MSIFDFIIRRHQRRRANGITFPEWFVVLNGCLPLVMLAYDARYHRLGPDPIHNALHTTGTIGLFLLVATLAVTPLQLMTGWNGILLYRRSLGLVAFLYSLLHIGIYVAHDQAGILRTAWNEVLTRRYLQIGAISFALLIPLALTSTPTMIRRLGFGRWKAVHRLSYLATVLAILHQYMQAKANVSQPLIFAVIVSTLLGYRLVRPFMKSMSR